MGHFSNYINATPSDPLTQALNVFTTLKSNDRADEEMALRRQESGRADARWAQEKEEGALRLRTGRAAADEADRLRTEQASQRLLRGAMSKLEAGIKLDPIEQAYLRTHAVGAANPASTAKENAEMGQAWTFAGAAATDLKDRAARGEITKPLAIWRGGQTNDQKEAFFRSLEKVSGGQERFGAVNDYLTVVDPATGATALQPGQVQRNEVAYFDPASGTLTVGMGVVDPATGQPRIDPKTGQPFIVPATEGRSAHPDDPLKVQRIDDIIAAASLGKHLSDTKAQDWDALPPKEQKKAILGLIAATGDPKAYDQLVEMNRVGEQIKALESAIPQMTDALQIRATRQQIDLMRNRHMTATEAETMTAKILGPEIAADAQRKALKKSQLEGEQANRLEIEKERGKAPITRETKRLELEQKAKDDMAIEGFKAGEAQYRQQEDNAFHAAEGEKDRAAQLQSAEIQAAATRAARGDTAKDRHDKPYWASYEAARNDYQTTLARLNEQYNKAKADPLQALKLTPDVNAWLQGQPSFVQAYSALKRAEDALHANTDFKGPLSLPPSSAIAPQGAPQYDAGSNRTAVLDEVFGGAVTPNAAPQAIRTPAPTRPPAYSVGAGSQQRLPQAQAELRSKEAELTAFYAKWGTQPTFGYLQDQRDRLVQAVNALTAEVNTLKNPAASGGSAINIR